MAVTYKRRFRGRIRAEVQATIRRLQQLLTWHNEHLEKGLLDVEPTVDAAFNVEISAVRLLDVLVVRMRDLTATPR